MNAQRSAFRVLGQRPNKRASVVSAAAETLLAGIVSVNTDTLLAKRKTAANEYTKTAPEKMLLKSHSTRSGEMHKREKHNIVSVVLSGKSFTGELFCQNFFLFNGAMFICC